MSNKAIKEAMELISLYSMDIYNSLSSGLENGSNSELGFDEELVLDIAKAFGNWRSRSSKIKDPYVVWYFNGDSWSKVTKDLYQQDAYREWYRLTKGGKTNNGPNQACYYFLGPSNLILEGRHLNEENAGDSIGYLLSKSFRD